MEKVTEYFKLQEEIFDYFGYVENWKVIPLADCRAYYWYVTGEGHGDVVRYSENEETLKKLDGNHFADEIYTQRFLEKWVYRKDDFTLICVDTNTDGNKFLSIYDNSKERPHFIKEEDE